MAGLFADDHCAGNRLEADDQADLQLRIAHVVPREPNAVRVSQARFAVTIGKLLGREHELPVGPNLLGIAAVFNERIDNQRALDLDRVFALVVVEHQSPAEPAPRRYSGLIEHRVGPHGDDLRRCGRFLLLPKERAAPVFHPGGTARA